MKKLIIPLLMFTISNLMAQPDPLPDCDPEVCNFIESFTCPDDIAICPCSNCGTPTSVGHVYKPNHCRSPMKGLLNRTARFHGMIDFKIAGDPRYCQMLQMATDLNISIMKNPASIWGTKTQIWWASACEMACEINLAYDRAGLSRPILEFSTPEFADWAVAYYPICQEIKDIFSDEIEEIFGIGAEYPYDCFEVSRIVYDDPSLNQTECVNPSACGTPDISKIEARMYHFYLAKRFIDCGYRGVNLAWDEKYSKNDLNHVHLASNIEKYRAYCEETLGKKLIVTGGPEILKVGDNFLLDYVESPMRPLELTAPNANVPDDFLICQEDPLAAYIPIDYQGNNPWNETCNDPLDPYVTGTTVEGCTGTMPILYRLDHHGGMLVPGGANAPTGVCYVTYGMDEATWWSNLSEECQMQFFEYYYCNLQGLDDKRFVEIPISVKANNHEMPSPDPWMLLDHPNVYDKILDISQPIDMDPNVTEFKTPINGQYCDIIHEPVIINGQTCKLIKGRQKHELKYLLSFDNIDCSSTYGWSIQKPDGSWVGYQEGVEFELIPDQSGTYKIIAQQRNSAFLNGEISEEIDLIVQTCSDEYTDIEIICPFCLSLSSNVSTNTVLVELHEDYRESTSRTFDIFVRNTAGYVVKTISDVSTMRQEIQIDVFDLQNGVYYIQTDLCNDLNLQFVKI